MELITLKKILPQVNTELLQFIANEAIEMDIPADTTLLKTGTYVQSVPLVVKGLIRVSRNEEDKELLLYYIRPGEMCIMSFSACCSNSASLIEAATLEESKILLIPSVKLREWITNFPTFNFYVYEMFNKRYLDLIDTIDQLIFNRLDERLYNYLKEKTVLSGNGHINVTHQQIATDMGTAREVISRLLKKLELENKISTSRNQVVVL
ncbi:MAG: Crp/Fnr family transcriptional regulator [Bacteroidales bacterium]|nr:Crp/Fnr family transcriptional regulator [Bacteroidales bacterium]